MTPKTFVGLAVATAVAVIGAGVTLSQDYARGNVQQVEDPVFPGLLDHVNDVESITLVNADGKFTLKRDGAGWGVTDLGGYPVRADRARTAIIQMAQLRYMEPKTRNPERYSKLRVSDVTAEGAKSRIVRLADASGTVMAEAIFGEDRFFMGGGPSKAGVYLRKVGEPQAWLARGRLEADARLRDWIVRDIVDVSSDRVKSITTVAADGTRVEMGRQSPDRYDFRLLNIPEGRKPKPDTNGAVFDMSRALSVLDLNDVKPVDQIPLEGAGRSTVEARTFDGLIVRGVLNDHKGDVWGTFSAALDEAVLAAPLTGEHASLKKPDEVRKEVEMLNKRLAGWAYELPSNKSKVLRVPLADLLAPPAS